LCAGIGDEGGGGLLGEEGKDDVTELLATWLTNILVSLNLSKPVYNDGSGPLEALASAFLPHPQPLAGVVGTGA